MTKQKSIAAPINKGRDYTYTHRGVMTLVYIGGRNASCTIQVRGDLDRETLDALIPVAGPGRVKAAVAALRAAGYEASSNK